MVLAHVLVLLPGQSGFRRQSGFRIQVLRFGFWEWDSKCRELASNIIIFEVFQSHSDCLRERETGRGSEGERDGEGGESVARRWKFPYHSSNERVTFDQHRVLRPYVGPQGCLTYKKHPPVGLYSSPMPRDLR